MTFILDKEAAAELSSLMEQYENVDSQYSFGGGGGGDCYAGGCSGSCYGSCTGSCQAGK